MAVSGDIIELAHRFGLGPNHARALETYVNLLCDWPGNVTGLKSRAEVVRVLVGDALALLDAPALSDREGAGWLDLGAGAGIPGIPLALALPRVELTLLDSASRKCAFLEKAVASVGLEGRARVVCMRSEHYAAAGAPGREAFAVVLARAVAPLPTLIELASPLLKAGGVLLASKTRQGLAEEAPRGDAAARLCGLVSEPLVPLPRSPLDKAVCAVYRKAAPTPSGIPRRPGMAAKRPYGA